MHLPRLLPLLLLAGQIASRAAILEVGSGEPFATIQGAVNAAAPGDTIRVAPGTYAESVVVNKSPLTLEGARSGTTARGRVTGTPNPAVESVIAPASGTALEIASSTGAITVRGFSLVSVAPVSSGVVTLPAQPASSLTLADNHIIAATGSTGAALWCVAAAENATLSGNVFLAAPGSPAAVHFDATGTWHGLHFLNNDVLRSGAAAHAGLVLEGNRNAGPGPRAVRISGNEFRGHAVGCDGGGRALLGAEISGNLFVGNTTGLSAGAKDSSVTGNSFSGNAICGLRLTASGHTTDAAWGAQGCIVEENTFSSNGATSDPSGYGDVALDDQAAATQAGNVFRRNQFLSAVSLFCNEPAGNIQAARNYWGSATGPAGGQISGSGSVVSAPYYKEAELLRLDFGSAPVTGLVTIGPGEKVFSPVLDLAPGAEFRVRRGSVSAGQLTLAAGAVLDVINGDLSLDPLGGGQFHTISGSFTFFDCLGSISIHASTTFSGSTLGLVSDIHVASGVTLFVLGSLILDGCSIDSTGPWNLLVNTGATFKMRRCTVSRPFISLAGGDISITDNLFSGAAVTAFSTVSGATVLHNVFTAGSFLSVLPGAGVTTTGEGWGNVNNPSLVRNTLTLDFLAPLNPTRTIDAGGNLYVQPGDPVAVGLDIGNLLVKAQAAEVLLGFNTDYLDFDSLAPSADWNNSLYETADASAVIGRLNTAIGLGFSFPDPDGTTLDQKVGEVQLMARSLEGRTSFFFRMKAGADHPLIDTRITASSGGVPFFRSLPFTRNAATLTVDGTAPLFGPSFTAVQIQNSIPLDVTQSGVITRQGTVTVTFDAVDLLAGVDDADVSIALNGLAGTIAGTLGSTATVNLSGVPYTRYTFTIPITASAPNGTYNLDATVMDRSGNAAISGLGALQIQKNQIAVTVQPQGLVSAPLTRNVVFTATDSLGGVLATWDVPVLFTGGLGSTTLLEVPDTTASLSAKMAWNLRTRLPAPLDVNGQSTVFFTGAAQLRGGDFNGDNLINLADYNTMRFVFPSLSGTPDINGDGQTNLADYNIFRLNWLTIGQPL